ncbi:MAG: M20/M25/M40 family metallo-hydrolase [Erysipelotrichaceae bacterium]|nr:M20/M25/M40 family metallo-hydrolase [Erysipelotrichaceae bacterium]
MKEVFEKLKALPEFDKACKILEDEEERTWEVQKELVLIPAFSRHEENKAVRFQQMLEEEGFATHRDAVNNVYCTIEGSDPKGPTLYMTGHFDTVFPLDTPLEVTCKDGKYYCPGIGDDTAALAQIFGIMRAIRDAGIKFKGNLIVGGNVGEEGLGDLYGMKHFFLADHTDGIDGFITVDGSGSSITYGGTGSHRYEVTFSGPGGHSSGDFGMPNPIHAMGRAIARFADMQVPNEPKTSFSIGVVNGGTSVNSIAGSCSMLVDMRSNGRKELEELDEMFRKLMAEAVEEENQRWVNDREKYSDKFTRGDIALCDKKVELTVKKIGDRPVGDQSEDSLIVKAAVAAYETMGLEVKLHEKGSLDANIPISLGIPGLGLGAGGESGGAHSLSEWFSRENVPEGQSKLILLLMGLLGVEGVCDPLLPKLENRIQ